MTDFETEVLSYLEEHRDSLVSYLQKLVNIDTQVPPGLNYDKVCTIMAEKFSECGCYVNVHNATEKYLTLSGADIIGLKGPRSNVVAKYKGKTGKTLYST